MLIPFLTRCNKTISVLALLFRVKVHSSPFIDACKNPPWLITRLVPLLRSHFLSYSLNKVRIRNAAAECAASQNKVRCICMQLNNEEYIFNRVRMSCSLMYYCACVEALPAHSSVSQSEPLRTAHALIVIDEMPQNLEENRTEAIQHRGD